MIKGLKLKHKLVGLALLLAVPLGTTANSDTKCLAEAIYHEARGEPYLGMLAVAQVVINRMRSPGFPGTICGVVYQPGQFSWTKTKTRQMNVHAVYVADIALSGEHELKHFRATYFHNHKVKPRWNNLEKVKVIGRHTFYKEKQ